ncbi:MAG: acyl-CoA dehydrogenase [Actinomycetia bacterium]|nr:acyl-CoA dehydrogenase [Actinomycetes bacterium]
MTHDELMIWAEGMVGSLGERAGETERLRELPAATIADAEEVGYFKMVVPAELGGWGLGLPALLQSTRVLAHGCMSSAWTLSFLALHNWFVARGPRQLHEQIFAHRPYARIPCPLAPTGTAVPVEGGYEVTGRWQWATGVQHGDWVMVNCMVDRGGQPESIFCLAPIGEVEIDDVWHTSGMRGTGSNDVVASGLFVPESRTVGSAEFRSDDPPGGAILSDPFVSYPLTPVLALVAASPALGGAEAAVDIFRDHIRSRVLPYSLGDQQAEQGASQVRLAEAIATVRAARLVWEDAMNQLCSAYDSGGQIDRTDRGRFRLGAAHTVRLSLQAVSIMVEGAGASVHFQDSPLGRIHRDLVTLKGHVVYDWDRAAQLAGKLELGIEPVHTDML